MQAQHKISHILKFLLLGAMFLIPWSAITASDIKNTTLATNLIAYWELEETSGTRVDSHGANDLTDNNTVLSATGIQGNGADFEDGNSEYLSVADPYDYQGSQDWTYSLWFKPESTPAAWEQLWYHWGTNTGTQLIISDTKVTIYVPKGTIHSNWQGTITGGFSAGTWYHLVVQFDGSAQAVRVWVNGTDDGRGWTTATYAAPFPTQTLDPNGTLYIGSNAGPNNQFDGVIDEFGFWERALSTTEVADLYNSGLAIPYDAGVGSARTPAFIIF